MIDVKYIYFESHCKDNGKVWSIENVNILLLEPHTNSSGYWGFRNVTKFPNYNWVVDQNWIDLTKFKFDKSNILSVDRLKSDVEKALVIVKNKIED